MKGNIGMADHNINRNSMNALKTANSSYMRHNAIENLFFNGENNFTVEVFFYLKNKESRSILYGQPEKFELGIDNGRIFLNAPGFCSFMVTENTVTLAPENFYYIAVTYNGSKISLFLQGYKIFEADKTGTSTRSQEPCCIGIGALGYICTIRVFSEVLADSLILSNNINELADRDSCAAWLVFSDIQPIDKSKNKLAISLVGEGARVVNLVACSSFSGMGCASLKNKVDKNRDAFTVLGKVYPLFTSGSEMVIYTSQSTIDGYTVLLRKGEGNNFRLIFSSANGELKSSTDVEANRWFDFAVVISAGNITMFINGAKTGEAGIASINLKGDACALVGAGYDDGHIGFSKGFSGYIDYIAEFEKSLDLTRVENYVDNPPFIFDQDLISSICLNCTTPSELVYDDPVWGYGDFRYVLAESTNQVNAPKGIQYFYPTQKDPLWDTLSPEEQWKINYYCTYMDSIVDKVMGLSRQDDINPVGMNVDLASTGTTGLVRRRVINRVPLRRPDGEGVEMEMQPLLRNRGNIQNRRIPRIRGNGFNGAVGGGAVSMSAGATGSAFCSGPFMAAVASAGVLVVVASIIIVVYNDRPEPAKSDIRIKSLRFNSNGDSTNGSLNCRKNSTITVPVTAVKNPTTGKIEIIGVFVPGDLTKIALTIELYCENGDGLTGKLKATETPGVIGDTVSGEFTINSGETKSISIDVDPKKLQAAAQGAVKRFETTWEWTLVTVQGETFLMNSSQIIFTTISRPRSPWICNMQPYNAGEIGYIWTDLLDVCCNAYRSFSKPGSLPADLEHIRTYTLELNNNSAFKYDKTKGASYYVTDFNTIKLQKYLNDRTGTAAKILNCTDCANIVAMEAVASGIDCTMGIMTFHGGFKCNQIQAIGYTNWEVPFAPGGGFLYHQVAVSGSADRTRRSSIFDACLKLDAGSYPGGAESSTYKKTPLLPVNYTFSETDDLPVNVPVTVAYDKSYYKERLVKDKSLCGLLSNPIPVAKITAAITKKALNMEDNGYREYFNAVKKQYGLEENPLSGKQRTLFNATIFPDSKRITGMERFELEEDYGAQKVYSATRDGNNYRMDIHQAFDEQKAYEILIKRLAFTANPDIRKRGDIEDIAFSIGNSYIITARNNIVITVSGKDAVELAKDLMNQI